MSQDNRIDFRISTKLKDRFLKYIMELQKSNSLMSATHWFIKKIENELKRKGF